MEQGLKILTALPDNLGLILSTTWQPTTIVAPAPGDVSPSLSLHRH